MHRIVKDNNIAEKIFDEILRQCIAKGLVGGEILYTDSTHIKAKANKHKKVLVTVKETPKEYMEELDEQIDLDRKALKKDPFDKDDNNPSGEGGTTTRMVSKQIRTADSKREKESRMGFTTVNTGL